jgi:DNA-binding beta-propeller fold protein YncE
MTLGEARFGVTVAMVVASCAGVPYVNAQSPGERVEFAGPAGVRCRADGTILVADDLSHRIVAMPPAEPVRSFGSYGSEPGRLLYPDAVHWRRDGSLVVADTGANRIQVLSADGRFVSAFGGTPRGVATGTRILGWVAPALLVAGVIAFALRVAGVLPPVWAVVVPITLGVAAGVIRFALIAWLPPGLTNPRDVWVDADDVTYVADFGSDVVRVFDTSGALMRTIGSPGGGPGALRGPLGVTIDATGHVLVTDSGNHRVVVFTKAGVYVSMFGGEGSEAGRFQFPHGIAVGVNGNRFVADRGNRRIQVLDVDGRPIAAIDRAMDGSAFTPIGVCLTPEGDLVASDSGEHRILRWPASWVRERLHVGPAAGPKVLQKQG